MMVARKVKVEKESKEEKVAKIGLKQTIVATAMTAIFTAIAAVSVAVINKPVTPNADAEIKYFKAKANLTLDDFSNVRNGQKKKQEAVKKQLAVEKDPEKIEPLKEADATLEVAITENIRSQQRVEKNVERSLEAINNGDGVAAAIHRKEANDEVRQANETRQNANAVVEKAGLQSTPKQDEVRAVQEPREPPKRCVDRWGGCGEGYISQEERIRSVDRTTREERIRSVECKSCDPSERHNKIDIDSRERERQEVPESGRRERMER